jgi:Mg2+/Co2+ transporter CorB
MGRFVVYLRETDQVKGILQVRDTLSRDNSVLLVTKERVCGCFITVYSSYNT